MPDSRPHLTPSPFYGMGTYLHRVKDAAGVVCDPHHHLYHELNYVVKGRGLFAVGARKVDVGAGDVFYLARGVYHWRMSDAVHPLELCNLTIDEQDLMAALNVRAAGYGSEWPWWRHWSKSVLTDADTQAFLRTLVGLMQRRPHAVRLIPRRFHDRPMLWRAVNDRVPPADVSRLLPGICGLMALGQKGRDRGPDLRALARRIRRAPHEPFRLDTEAARLGISRWWLSRIFRRRFGVTLWEHRDYARIDLAIRRLLTSDLPVGELGQSLGFRGTAQFIATFKRLTGLTPGRLRRLYDGTMADAALEYSQGATNE